MWLLVGLLIGALLLVATAYVALSSTRLKTTWNASDSTAAPVVLDTPIPASPEPTAQPAVVPAATFTPTLAAAPAEILPTATPTPIHQAPGAAVTLTGFDYIRQTWNNCGPATLAMHLSYFGSDLNQATIGAVLRPYQDDKNVNPVELAEYAREQGYHALVRVNGDRETLRTLLANGIPAIIETWLIPHPNDELGHYRLLTGYDDAGSYWIGYDSYYRVNLINPSGDYQGIRMDYTETDDLWRVFNHTYVVIYTDAQAPLVASILGEDLNDGAMWQRALATARAAVDQDPTDAFAWFNLGTNLSALGRYAEAADAYDRARQIGLPPRMFWYQFGPLQAYYNVGRYQDVIDLADSVLRPAVQIEELHDWKARAYEALGNTAAAGQSRQRVAALNSHYQPHYGEIPLSQVDAPAIEAEEVPAAVMVEATVAAPAAPTPEPATTIASDTAEFVADVTIPDGSLVAPGEPLSKTWRIRNTSGHTWEGYVLKPVVYEGGQTHQMGAPETLPIATTAPGETVDITMNLVAPVEPGTHVGYWQMVPPDGHHVTGGQLWVIIEVVVE